ncbi:hypothetical protein HK25_13380 [Acetobacter sp. DsW_059]|nr:hypothetical protein HK25_13380 [Acetobacter sp. DsW_059]
MSAIFWYRLLFRLRLHEADSMSFQSLVNSVFEGVYDDFQSIAPWGKSGDGGNDGYIPSVGHYLQVYGPKAGSSWTSAAAAKKAEEDFLKLKVQWVGLQRYSFVLNDRFQGVPAPVEQKLQRIQTTHKIKADAIACAKLTNSFTKLPEHLMIEIVGGVPSEQPGVIDTRAMGELIDHLASKAAAISTRSKGLAPDFEEKLEFNGLSDEIGSRLRANSYQSADVTAFLDTRDQWLAQGIAQELRNLYEGSKSTITGVEDAADLRYVWMLEEIVPNSAKQNIYTQKAFQGAAEVILAHFFEACDVYDKPTAGSGAT